MLFLLEGCLGDLVRGFGDANDPWTAQVCYARRNMVDTRYTLFRWCFWGL